MKLLVAIVRQEKLEAIQEALNRQDISGLTISEVRGCGRQRGYTEVYRGTEMTIRLLPKLKIEIAVEDRMVPEVLEAIIHAGRSGETGEVGDGKVFVLPMYDGIRLRTGERGPRAIRP